MSESLQHAITSSAYNMS